MITLLLCVVGGLASLAFFSLLRIASSVDEDDTP